MLNKEFFIEVTQFFNERFHNLFTEEETEEQADIYYNDYLYGKIHGFSDSTCLLLLEDLKERNMELYNTLRKKIEV